MTIRAAAASRAVAETIQRTLPLSVNWAALESGCGTGLVTALLAPELGSVLATDLSPGMLAMLDEKKAAEGWRMWEPRCRISRPTSHRRGASI